MHSVEPQLERTQLLKGILDAVVLAALAAADGYGYDVVRCLRAGGLADIADASVYGTLRRLFGQGLLTSYVVPSDEGPHRKYYGLTPAGRDALAAHRGEWAQFADAVGAILTGVAFNTKEVRDVE